MGNRILILCAFVFLIACGEKEPENETVDTTSQVERVELPASFVPFYAKFLRDSVYQMEHIQFPLPGRPVLDTAGHMIGTSEWEAAGWLVHTPFTAEESGFSSEFTPIGENTVIELIRHSSNAYYLERRFLMLRDQWKLIYYSGMRSAGDQ